MTACEAGYPTRALVELGGDHEEGAHAGVEPVAESVPQEIEREDGGHYGQGWEDDQMRGIEEVAAGVVQHGAPARHWSKNSYTEEA